MEPKNYVFANWGEKVYVIDGVGRFKKGVITEFDTSDDRNTKVVYKNGGFDWYNRLQVEKDCKTKEFAHLEVIDPER